MRLHAKPRSCSKRCPWMSFITQRSAMTEWPMPTAVVAHDAGAANLIIAWIKAWGWPVRACVQGPALKLWDLAFPGHPIWPTPAEAMAGCASLLTGTGWASPLEHDARREGHARGLRVAAVVDHWVNYPQRFERACEIVLPDELWVADAWATMCTLMSMCMRSGSWMKVCCHRPRNDQANSTAALSKFGLL